MDRKLLGLACVVLASWGCSVCSNCCDYLPPVANGPHQSVQGRAGSRSAALETTVPEPIATAESTEDDAITPTPSEYPAPSEYPTLAE